MYSTFTLGYVLYLECKNNESSRCSAVESPRASGLTLPQPLTYNKSLTCRDLRALVDVDLQAKNNDAYTTLIRHKAHVNRPTDHATRGMMWEWETDLTNYN